MLSLSLSVPQGEHYIFCLNVHTSLAYSKGAFITLFTIFLEFRPHDMRDEYILFHFIFSVGLSSSISILNKNCERRMSSGSGSGKLNVRFQTKLRCDSIISVIISNTCPISQIFKKCGTQSDLDFFLHIYSPVTGAICCIAEWLRQETLSYLFHFTFCKLAKICSM